MDGPRALLTHLILGWLLAIQLISIFLSARNRQRLRRQLAVEQGARARLYRRVITGSWALAAYVPLVVLLSDLSPHDVGWAWPAGDGLDYLLAAYLLLVSLVGGARLRRRSRRGQAVRQPNHSALLVPRNRQERRLAVLLAISAAVTEEAMYRGLYLAAGTHLYHLPMPLAALASIALFGAAHALQGRRGMLGVTVLGALYTALYLLSGSLLLPIVVHLVQDLVALLLIPAEPTPAPPDATPCTDAAARTQPTPDHVPAPRTQPGAAEDRDRPGGTPATTGPRNAPPPIRPPIPH